MHNITKSQLKAWLEEKGDMLLIDVLPKETFAVRHNAHKLSFVVVTT